MSAAGEEGVSVVNYWHLRRSSGIRCSLRTRDSGQQFPTCFFHSSHALPRLRHFDVNCNQVRHLRLRLNWDFETFVGLPPVDGLGFKNLPLGALSSAFARTWKIFDFLSFIFSHVC